MSFERPEACSMLPPPEQPPSSLSKEYIDHNRIRPVFKTNEDAWSVKSKDGKQLEYYDGHDHRTSVSWGQLQQITQPHHLAVFQPDGTVYEQVLTYDSPEPARANTIAEYWFDSQNNATSCAQLNMSTGKRRTIWRTDR
jgi:hypothetical protein